MNGFIDTTPKNVEWLIQRLYTESRNLAALGIENPVFVLLTQGPEKRDAVEASIWKHLKTQYGSEGMFKQIEPDARFKTSTKFRLPPLNATILLMDVMDEFSNK